MLASKYRRKNTVDRASKYYTASSRSPSSPKKDALSYMDDNINMIATTQRDGGLHNVKQFVQGSAKRWDLGCVNSLPVAGGSQETGFTQPRDHLLADPCRSQIETVTSDVEAKEFR